MEKVFLFWEIPFPFIVQNVAAGSGSVE